MTYAPWAKDQDPIDAKSSGIFSFLRTAVTEEPRPPIKPRKEQVERDFAMLAGKVEYVRTYRTSDGGEYMPEVAARVGLKLVPGAWIYSANEAKLQFGRDAAEVNAEETRALIRMANQNPNIERVLVGNENILRWDGQKDLRDPNAVSPAQLIREIRNVKRNVKVPVSTAEPWHVWLNYPELAKEVDYLAVHILPYWDEQSSETPLEYLKDKIGQLQAGLSEQEHHRHRGRLAVERRRAPQPRRPASSSTRRRPSRPGTSATWSRWLKAQNIEYFVVEAIDQPWKSYDLEGKAGGYWGLWNADRQQKFEWTGPIETFPQWWVMRAVVAAGGAADHGASSCGAGATSASLGQLAFCGLVALSTSAVAYGASVAAGTYMVTGEMVGWGVLAFFLVLSLAMALVQALELVETIWRRHWVREALPAAEMIARQPADRRLAQGLDPCRDLQRAAGDGDPDHRIRWPRSTIPTSKSSSSTTTPRTPRCGGRCRITARSSASASSSSTST